MACFLGTWNTMVMRKPRINLIFDWNFIPVFVLPSLCFDALWWKCFHKLVHIREREWEAFAWINYFVFFHHISYKNLFSQKFVLIIEKGSLWLIFTLWYILRFFVKEINIFIKFCCAKKNHWRYNMVILWHKKLSCNSWKKYGDN